MEAPTDRGLPFELDTSWRPIFLAPEPEQGNLFLPPDFDLPSLVDGGAYEATNFQLELAEVVESNGSPTSTFGALDGEILSSEDVATLPALDQADHNSDIWGLDLCNSSDDLVSSMRTWEAFDKKAVPNTEHIGYLSEAGPGALDAALVSPQPQESCGVLPQDDSLRALCNLALGRSSLFFQWDEKKQSFTRTLSNVPTTGFSLQCSQSFAIHIMDYGSAYRRLEIFAESLHPAGEPCATVTALKRSVASILEAIEAHISHTLPAIFSPLQLQDVLQRPLQLLEVLQSLSGVIKDGISDEQAISAIADQVYAVAETGTTFAPLLRTILARVCGPWLSALARDLGLSSSQHPGLQNPRDDAAGLGDADLSITEVSALDNEIPTVLSREDRKLIEETRASLTILRQHLPDYDLCLEALPSVINDWPDNTVSVGSGVPELYGIPGSRCRATTTVPSEVTITQELHDSETEHALWGDHASQMNYLERMDARLSRLPTTLHATPADELRSATDAALTADHVKDLCLPRGFELALSIMPFDELRPLVASQSTRLNMMLLRHLFTTCQLRRHLDLQHAFHLFGNGNFVSRLSTALFSPETQSAERRRDTIPTGETMGLRLGVRGGQPWPPASSELRLTLMGVLSEAYHNNSTPALSGKQVELPGGLSFAIRELPDAEIDRVMDANSIYALDFLRLQYSAPAPLDAIFTRVAMRKYDDIFRHLLKLMRVLDTTKRLRRTHANAGHRTDGRAACFAAEAHHFVITLMSHVMDIGISAPWRVLQQALDGIERAGATGEAKSSQLHPACIGINGLRELHDQCLDTVRTRMYLKRKQEGPRTAVEAVLAAILEVAAMHQDVEGREQEQFERRLAKFREAVLALIRDLQNLVDRPLRGRVASDAAQEEGEMAKLLLSRLNWNAFYGG
ncbi:hypothetical protein LTR85_004836 [Meristemomyces frigidus]|nr:hypothetical protein LTR85_004836 [Meristemomyces frigidus]